MVFMGAALSTASAADEAGHGDGGGGCGTLYDYVQGNGQGGYYAAHTGPGGATNSAVVAGWTEVGWHYNRQRPGEIALFNGFANTYPSHGVCEP